jgi:hypothetical protein
MFSLYKLPYPSIPFYFEISQSGGSCVLIADGVIDGMISNKFEVSQCPVVRYGCQEIIHSAVLNTEFARIVRVYRDCIAKAQ